MKKRSYNPRSAVSCQLSGVAPGLTLVDVLIALGVTLLLGTFATLGILDARRRARDAGRLSIVRQAQARLEAFRHERASYPGPEEVLAVDLGLPEGFTYLPLPEGCGADLERLCGAYEIGFVLEGRVGSLAGGDCAAAPDGIRCAQPER